MEINQVVVAIIENMSWSEDNCLCLGDNQVDSNIAPWCENGILLQVNGYDDLVTIDEILNKDHNVATLTPTEMEEVEAEFKELLARRIASNQAVEEFYNTHHIEMVEFSGDNGYTRSSSESYTQERYVHNVTGEISYKVGQEPTAWELPTLEEAIAKAARDKYRVQCAVGYRKAWVAQNIDYLASLLED